MGGAGRTALTWVGDRRALLAASKWRELARKIQNVREDRLVRFHGLDQVHQCDRPALHGYSTPERGVVALCLEHSVMNEALAERRLAGMEREQNFLMDQIDEIIFANPRACEGVPARAPPRIGFLGVDAQRREVLTRHEGRPIPPDVANGTVTRVRQWRVTNRDRCERHREVAVCALVCGGSVLGGSTLQVPRRGSGRSCELRRRSPPRDRESRTLRRNRSYREARAALHACLVASRRQGLKTVHRATAATDGAPRPAQRPRAVARPRTTGEDSRWHRRYPRSRRTTPPLRSHRRVAVARRRSQTLPAVIPVRSTRPPCAE